MAETPFEPDTPPWQDVADPDTAISSAFQLIGNQFDGYQQRKGQLIMARKAFSSLMSNRPAIIEAGTGVGKSFAYLTAAIAWSYFSGERVLIVTETKNLQLQLMEKDLPFLQQVLAESLSFELCLGSSNYLCRTRYEDTFNRGDFFELIDEETTKLFHKWASQVLKSKTLFGVEYDFSKKLRGGFWSKVNRDSDACPANKCIYFSNCNYYRARKQWQESRILIANHHLFLLHILNEKRTLPPYGGVITDEAHGLLKTGYSIFTLSFSRESMQDLKRNIERINKEIKAPANWKTELKKEWSYSQKKWDQFFTAWEVELNLSFEQEKTETIQKSLKENLALLNSISSLKERLTNFDDENQPPTALNTLKGVSSFLKKAEKFCTSFENFQNDKFIYWASKKKGIFTLHVCPLHIGEEIERNMEETFLFTSATLGYWPSQRLPNSKNELIQKGYFRQFQNQILPNQDSLDLMYDLIFSPFDYQKNVALYLPNHIPEPRYGSDDAQIKYQKKLFSEIKTLVKMSEGGALVLFTSIKLLNNATAYLREEIEHPVFSQIEDGAKNALQFFRQDPHSVLLGTTSYWQGIDISGSGLRLTIIPKMMFIPPNDPIFKARSDFLESQGKRAFQELALPFAATMLRQAFGRLIRHETDRGVVAILDPRLSTKAYGNILMANLPPSMVAKNQTQLKKIVKEYSLFNTNL